MLLLHVTINKSMSVKDKGLLWFSALVVFRYWRAIVTRLFYTQYRAATVPEDKLKFTPSDCTVIVPTVGPANNPMFALMVEGILRNKPDRLIFAANNEKAKELIERKVEEVKSAMRGGKRGDEDCSEDRYEDIWDAVIPITNWTGKTVIEAKYIEESNKRKQTEHAIKMVETDITFMVDDTAIWHPRFLQATLPAFNDPKVGLVGTRKRVQYKRPSHTEEEHKEKSRLRFWLSWYRSGFWNTVGAQYLDRHSYEIRASNAGDGAVFAISGRTLAILTDIVKDSKFREKFVDEYVLTWVFKWLSYFKSWHISPAGWLLKFFEGKGLTEKGIGPLLADDDNFITRWVIDRGWNIKVQSSLEATMMTRLGSVKIFKYVDQCERWSRTTFRQNPIALFSDRTIWWKWPIGVWTVYFPWMYNFAVFWDGLAIFNFWRSGLYQNSSNGNARLVCLILAIWATKLIKTWRWFREHPLDFLLFFVIPAYPLFGYYHSWLKLYTAISCWKNDWSGRDVKKAEKDAGAILREKYKDIIISGSKKQTDGSG
ncbi:uncharacterized protein J4E84_003060 [Alternaria hordeiaustralica]|uniref:uncharacterized protein n=1 Tax=Alternaria hordeiaustralica TaxID=1187925 RepID=UPI0020C2EA19|nr:uncharacterized protein J4E84_003060 [Alternaria hordeiaustralica]KAI4692092.1 hypothetical protein J4E84_003060 [Alternaria hordeiaustralica]